MLLTDRINLTPGHLASLYYADNDHAGDEHSEGADDHFRGGVSASATTDHCCVAIHARRTLLQPQSPLLCLPAELRLQMCSYMTLLPTTVEWNGAFFSCRQLHKDMLNQLQPRKEMYTYLRTLPTRRLKMGTPHPLFGWIRSITLGVKLANGWCGHPFKTLYALHLDNLQILLTGNVKDQYRNGAIATPHEDLTTLGLPDLLVPTTSGVFRPVVTDVTINCKKITLTLDQLAKASGARDKQISYEVALAGTDIVYLFTVVQNKESKQVERSYTFDTRFETPTPLPAYEEEDDEKHDERKDDERENDAKCEDCGGEDDEPQGIMCVVL